MQKSEYFKGKELASPEVYKVYGEDAIKFIAKDIVYF